LPRHRERGVSGGRCRLRRRAVRRDHDDAGTAEVAGGREDVREPRRLDRRAVLTTDPEHAMSVQTISTDAAPAAIGPYAQATIAGGFLFTAGQIPLDPTSGEIVAGDIEPQSKQVLANLKAVLATAGLDWSDVV